ncbi:TPA: glycosyltransferase family 2 protein [Escherichia coli]|uniref:glycosyltransferase family 2 protein n=1 Tax=Enterobacteriaceae TaxID=543 RepID=UPI000943828C|nr:MULTISPECIES: glycosyltransferase family 2 protein [Enterobacteriaceae]EFE7940081.1 glycosyltransferase family 2 protein [Escherichia coli]EFG4205997.1 glycosyltransferase family 2 protein [Escherichia coli]EFH8874480.1 glycosyltransferase [Escherichia coli]EFN4527080.1 glycosyltransferase family 2 protein [Escherichia coli]EKS1207432.1 glycosyltransferase family 2 protein [Escherichia coli]
MNVAINNKNKWEVPAYDISLWTYKKHDACIVIPVINEGERIISLLNKMKQININQIADIIIVDGGSTDGSLETGRLLDLNVSGLLLKTGSGKLSSQLRCGYAFVLEKGYKNIITIDGNDKDDPTPIPEFLNALNQGYDFVQASRFVSGGVAVNTPKTRDLAIKFIHAPALSIASGFHWTDTTQGFRGYSSRLLLDERVAPFRNIFITYELLAYLSYIAPKLGFSCIELPTSRIYPEGEVPTKISSFRGNLSVLKILFKACLGHYNISTNK